MTGQPEPLLPGEVPQAAPADHPAARPVGEVLLEAVNLTAGYGDLAAVRDANLRLHRGEIVAVVGPNGAGKTTTMHALVGELPLLRGEVRWLGRKVSSPLHRRVREGLGYVPEVRSIIMSMSCRDNLRLGRGDMGHALELFPRAGAAPVPARRAAVRRGAADAYPRPGPRGPAGRARRGRTLPRPGPGRRRPLMEALRVAAKKDGCGVLLVEQQARRALAIADRWYLFRNGRNVASGDTRSGPQVMEQAYLARTSHHDPLSAESEVVA